MPGASEPALLTGSWRLFDHTADLGVEVSAPDREQLFETSAEALVELMGGAAPLPDPRERVFDVKGADLEELLVRWLSELLAEHEAAGVSFDRFSVSFPEPGRARGVARTAAPGAAPRREIKAVTYHGVSVAPAGDGRWAARFVLDV